MAAASTSADPSAVVSQDIQLMSLRPSSGVECYSTKNATSPDKEKIVMERRHAAGTDASDAVPCASPSPRQIPVVAQAFSESSQVGIHRSNTEPTNMVQTDDAAKVKSTVTAAMSAPDLRESECDVFVICCEDDEDNAGKFKQILKKFLRQSNDRNPLFFREMNFGDNKFNYLEEGIARSRFRFIFLDKDCSEDAFEQFKMHYALFEMIERKDHSIIPVKAHSNVFIPRLLRMFNALDIQYLLRDRCLDGIGDISELTEADVNRKVLAKIEKIINQPSYSSETAGDSTSAEFVRELDVTDAPKEAPGANNVTPTSPKFCRDHQQSAYPMNKVVRGHACIISVFKTRNYQDRHGTDKDRPRLEALFKQFNFKVKVYQDDDGLKAQDILDKIKLTAAMDVDTCPPQCYVLIILCHGEMDKRTREEFVLGTDGERLSKQTILDTLAAEENLRDTPCLVFFVCCRDADDDTRHDGVSVNKNRHFFVAFPCKEACSSYRHVEEGTYYARSLVNVLTESAHNTELKTLIEKVKIDVQKQIDVQIADDPVSTLKKKFYFFPGITV